MRRDHQKREYCELNDIKLIEIFEEKEIDDLINKGVIK